MIKQNRIQQFHKSPKAAIEYVNKSIGEPHGFLASNYQGMRAVRAKKSKKQPVKGQKLYDIYLKVK